MHSMGAFFGVFVGNVPKDMLFEEQLAVEEFEEILIQNRFWNRKKEKWRGNLRHKFKTYLQMDAKWMEETELADSSPFY